MRFENVARRMVQGRAMRSSPSCCLLGLAAACAASSPRGTATGPALHILPMTLTEGGRTWQVTADGRLLLDGHHRATAHAEGTITFDHTGGRQKMSDRPSARVWVS